MAGNESTSTGATTTLERMVVALTGNLHSLCLTFEWLNAVRSTQDIKTLLPAAGVGDDNERKWFAFQKNFHYVNSFLLVWVVSGRKKTKKKKNFFIIFVTNFQSLFLRNERFWGFFLFLFGWKLIRFCQTCDNFAQSCNKPTSFYAMTTCLCLFYSTQTDTHQKRDEKLCNGILQPSAYSISLITTISCLFQF